MVELETSTNRDHLIVLSELAFFRGHSKFIDPFNLAFATEYYLLENLSVGLVSESFERGDQWEPRLAKKWKQINSRTWKFYLYKNLCWSDGSPLTLEQVADHFEVLRKEKSRHLTLLKTVESISLDRKSNSLILRFINPVNEGLLHELSLADAAILHPKNLNDDWSVASGPYYVSLRTLQEIQLKANEFYRFPLDIQAISIRSQKSPFNNYDILFRPSAAFRSEFVELTAAAPNVYLGYPMLIYYFFFPELDERSNDFEIRKAFRWFIHASFANFKSPGVLVAERQLVPNGYSGRLSVNHVDSSEVHIRKLQGLPLLIKVVEKIQEVFSDLMLAEAKKHGIELNFTCTENEPRTFAAFRSFMGNQQDPLSSFRFLYGEGGPLHRFYPQVEFFFTAIASASEDRRKQLLLDLHEFTLKQAYVVPFFAEYVAILHSDRVDLSLINRHDMRLRFFEMKWKK